MKTFTFASFKGGVGKSSLALLTTNYLASAGKRVLHIDADPQNSSTFYFFPGEFDSVSSLANILNGDSIINNIMPAKENINLIPSSFELVNVVNSSIDTDILLQQLPTVSKHYDYCVIDTGSATINNVIANCIVASDLVITPVIMGGFDLKSAKAYHDTFVSLDMLSKWRIVYNKARKLDRLTTIFYQIYNETFDKAVLKTRIPESSIIKQYFDVDMKITRAKNKVQVFNAISKFVAEITGKVIDTKEF